MGSWGVKLYQSDVADMVRDDYKNKLRAGKSDEETLEEMLIEYQYERADDEDKFDYWPALADTMWKYGRLTPEVRDICLKIIAATKEDMRWETPKDQEKREKEMQKLKENLLSDMPARKKVSVHKPYVCDWKEREVYAMRIEDDGENGKYNGYYIVFYVMGMYKGDFVVPGIYDTVPKVYMMMSKKRIERVEEIRKLPLCCCLCEREKNLRRIIYILLETSNRKKPKTLEYIGRMDSDFVPKVDYHISDMQGLLKWFSLTGDAICDYEFNLKLNRELQEKRDYLSDSNIPQQ